MRIAIAHSFYRRFGGEDRYVEAQAELLQAAGHEVLLIRRNNSELPSSSAAFRRMAFSPGEIARVRREFEVFSPEVVHLHNAYPALGPAIQLVGRRAGIPLVMTVHNFRMRCPNGYMFTEGQTCRRCQGGNYAHAVLHHCFESGSQASAYATTLWGHRHVLRLERMTSAFVVASDFMRRELRSWGIREDSIHLIRHFTEIPEKPPKDLGNGGVYVGRLSSEKGLSVLLESLARADDPPFLVIGSGPIEADLRDLAQHLRLFNTQFLGHLSPADVAKYLSQSRFLVMPSIWMETAGLAPIEALAHGRPVIVTDQGALPELVQEGAGIAVRAGDADALASAIRRLQNDDGLCIEMGATGHAYVQRNFNSSAHLELLEALYSALSREDS